MQPRRAPIDTLIERQHDNNDPPWHGRCSKVSIMAKTPNFDRFSLLVGLLAAGLGVAGCSNGDATEVLALGGVATPQEAGSEGVTSAPSTPLKPFVGRYRHVGGEEEKRLLSQKIEDVASSFNLVAKGIVKDSLVTGTAVADEISIVADGDTLTIRNGAANTNSVDGAPVSVTVSNGEKMDLTYAVSGSEVTETLRGDGRGRVNRYVVDDDKLIVRVKIHATQFPHDLVYDLTYERVAETKLASWEK